MFIYPHVLCTCSKLVFVVGFTGHFIWQSFIWILVFMDMYWQVLSAFMFCYMTACSSAKRSCSALTTFLSSALTWPCCLISLKATLKPQATDHHTAMQWLVHWPLMGWAVTFGIARRGPGGRSPPRLFLVVPNVTAHPTTVYQLHIIWYGTIITFTIKWLKLSERLSVRHHGYTGPCWGRWWVLLSGP